MNVEEFKKRMQHQKELELLAWKTYSEFANEIGEGEYQTLFLKVSAQEEHHARIIDSILAKL